MKLSTKTCIRVALAVACVHAGAALADLTLYQSEQLQGQALTTQRNLANLQSRGFNEQASSIVVTAGRWEVCEDRNYTGRCVVLPRGVYPSLRAMGLNNRISSARLISDRAHVAPDRFAPPAEPFYDARRRHNERLYEAPVRSVRAVFGPPEQRCWIEREMISSSVGNAVPSAVLGALIGGILGHQVGGGSGKDFATAGGALAGAAIGSQMAQGAHVQDVQRCSAVPGPASPSYWDVVYVFRGTTHRVQLQHPPGPTITVNGRGEPRYNISR